jgi:ArlS sensor domain
MDWGIVFIPKLKIFNMLKIFLVKFILKKLTGAKENQNQLFQRTRCQLAAWYVGIIGVILGLCGLGVYEAIIYAQRLTIDQKLESYANELHEILEPVLKHPGELEAQASAILPQFCIVETGCQGLKPQGTPLANTVENDTYYIRLLDLSGKLIAIIGQEPRGLQTAFKKEEMWQDLKNIQGDRYRQISVILHNRNFDNWGYLQVARTLKDLDRYRSNLELMLLMGLPAAILILAIASWWLAGKAMEPIYQSYRQIQLPMLLMN